MRFYRSQFWRLQKQLILCIIVCYSFIGHNFGDYKNLGRSQTRKESVLSVTILETTKTIHRCVNFFFRVLSVTILETTKTYAGDFETTTKFYRSQFWRLQKPQGSTFQGRSSFIGHNFGDYKNRKNFWITMK